MHYECQNSNCPRNGKLVRVKTVDNNGTDRCVVCGTKMKLARGAIKGRNTKRVGRVPIRVRAVGKRLATKIRHKKSATKRFSYKRG